MHRVGGEDQGGVSGTSGHTKGEVEIRGGENLGSGNEMDEEEKSQDIPRGMERLPGSRGMDMGARGKLG